MKVSTVEIETPSRSDTIKLTLMGDEHKGALDHDAKLFKASLGKIAADDNHYWLGMGDPCEFIAYSDKRFDPRDYDMRNPLHNSFQRQADEYVKDVSIVPEKRRLGLILGNHDDKVTTRYHYDVHEHICQGLSRRPNFGLSYSAILKLRFIRKVKSSDTCTVLKLCLHHGHGGGRRAGSKINKVEDLAFSYPFCHIYAMGHCHDRFIRPAVATDCTPEADELIERPRFLAMTGTYKRSVTTHNSSWGEQKQFPPTSIGCITFEIQPFANSGPVITGICRSDGLPG